MPKPKKLEKKKKPAVQPRPGQSLARDIESALHRKNYAEAAELADDAMKRHPTNPVFPEMLAEALVEMGMNRTALTPACRLLLLTPDRLRSLHLAAIVYANNNMNAHAARCIRRFFELSPEDPAKEGLQRTCAKADDYIRAVAEALDASFEAAEEGSFWLEEANVHILTETDLPLAIEELRRSIQLLPKTIPARDYLADALLKTGQLEEAERVLREALAIDPSDIDARWQLMLCARARYDDPALQAAYASLKDATAPDDRLSDQIHLAQAHGLMGDHERAYACARQAADSRNSLPNYALYALAAAAANTGRFQEAKGFYRLYKANGGSIDREIDSLTAGLPGPNVASSYPYFDDATLIHPPYYREIMKPLFESLEVDDEDARLRVDLGPEAERFPQIVWIAEMILYEEDLFSGLALLLSIRTERSVQIVRDLAESPTMTWSARINAATSLMDHGFLKEGETLLLWNGAKRIEIGPEALRALIQEPDLPEDVRAGLGRSNELFTEDPDRAEEILLGLLARHPNVPQIHHNLALLQWTEEDRKNRLLRALEIDPNYDRARIALASFHAYAGRPDEAEEALASFEEDHLFKPSDYVALLYARALIERARRRYDAAIILLRQALRENLYYGLAYNTLIRLETAMAEGRIDRNARLNMEAYLPDSTSAREEE